MSNAKNIIDNLKNQGANPDKSQINLINELCNLNIRRKFPFYEMLFNDRPSGIYICPITASKASGGVLQ